MWHFKQFQLPYDFMLPYEQKEFMKEFEALNSHLNLVTNDDTQSQYQRDAREFLEGPVTEGSTDPSNTLSGKVESASLETPLFTKSGNSEEI